MIALFLSIAMAKMLPGDFTAEKTCGLIAGYYQRQAVELVKRNQRIKSDCEKAKKNLPKDQQKYVQCIEYYIDDSAKYVSTGKFLYDCEKALSTMPAEKPNNNSFFSYDDCVRMGFCK